MQKQKIMITKVIKTTLALLMCVLLMPQLACSAARQELLPTSTAAASTAQPPTPSPSQERSIDSFRAGDADELGYSSTYFGFGFHIPSGWTLQTRDQLDQMNGIQASRSDSEEYLQETIEHLKSGAALFDFYAYRDEEGEFAFVFALDYTNSSEEPVMEVAVLEQYIGTIIDFDKDGKENVENVRLETVDLLGVEHPVYRCNEVAGGGDSEFALLAIKQGTSVALIEISGPDENRINSILDSFYPVP